MRSSKEQLLQTAEQLRVRKNDGELEKRRRCEYCTKLRDRHDTSFGGHSVEKSKILMYDVFHENLKTKFGSKYELIYTGADIQRDPDGRRLQRYGG